MENAQIYKQHNKSIFEKFSSELLKGTESTNIFTRKTKKLQATYTCVERRL